MKTITMIIAAALIDFAPLFHLSLQTGAKNTLLSAENLQYDNTSPFLILVSCCFPLAW